MNKRKLLGFIKSDIGRIAVGAFFFIAAFISEQFGVDVASTGLYIAALAVCGYKVFVDAIRGIVRRDLLDEKLLMSIASIGAMIIGEFSEGVAVMLFFLIGEAFEHMAVKRSRASIRSLMDICPDEACVLAYGSERIMDAEDVEVGSTIVVRPGERVPIDCVVISGSADVDTSAMTGESMPTSVSEGCSLDSGYVVMSGLLNCRTLRRAEESAAARVLALVEDANENKSREERFITKFSHYYTPLVVIAAVLLAVIPPLFRLSSWTDAVYRALIFLVISCPCALVISVPMAFFGGIGGAASRGILYKGGNVFSAIANADIVAFDKTGTVTSGEFSVSSLVSYGVTDEELLRYAASAEYASNHPMARCIKGATLDTFIPDSAEEIAGEGVIAHINDYVVGVGNSALMARLGVDASDFSQIPNAVFVARDGALIGLIYISDSIKPEARTAVSELKALGVRKTAILSGDRKENVEKVGSYIGVGELYFELSPEEKYNKLEELIASSDGGTIYVGDGINDAPSLARADVGVSMGRMGQDSAIEASDVVIMTDNLSKISEAIRIARKTLSIARQNIVFALGTKGLILVLGAVGLANMWLAVFADVGVAVLAILNSMRALRYSVRKPRANL